MWHALEPVHRDSILEFAQEKLIGAQVRGLRTLKESAQIAMVSVRLLLDIEPARVVSRRMDESLVASHMRIAFSVPHHHEFMRTGTPSEPILAKAAALLMNHKAFVRDAGSFSATLGVLNEIFESGFSAKGELGELVGRLLDIAAMDAAARARAGSADYGVPITVVEYLQQLVPLGDHRKVLKCLPSNRHCIAPKFQTLTLEEAFSNAYIHVTHYARAGDHSVLQAANLWAHWARGTAFQLKPGQVLSDRVLPIHWRFWNDEDPIKMHITESQAATSGCPYTERTLGPHNCSAILHQDKNTTDKTVVGIRPRCPEDLKMFDGTAAKPVIAITHLYGSKDATVSVSGQDDMNLRCRADNRAPLYEITIGGLKQTSYGLVQGDAVSEKLEALLGRGLVFDEHPHQDEESLKVLRSMLPSVTKDMGWVHKEMDMLLD